MPTRDNYSNQRAILAFNQDIVVDTTTVSTAILDTADYDMGIMFICFLILHNAGSFQIIINESDDPGMAGENVVADKNILGTLPTLTAALAEGGQTKEFGVVGTKRFLQISVASSGASTANFVVVNAIERGEYNPQGRV